jgi:hypothetical protein
MSGVMMRSIEQVLPAQPGWVAVLGDPHDQKKQARVPVIAWIYGEVVPTGENFYTERATRMWSGIALWENGPADVQEMSDFLKFDNPNPEAWGVNR